MIARALVYYSLFYEPIKNFDNGMLVWSQCALASGLHINWKKSNLISRTKRNLESFGWQGHVVRNIFICLHLRYPLAVNVTNVELMNGWLAS